MMEILAVVAIIALLVTIGAEKLSSFGAGTRRATCLVNQATIAATMGRWEAKNSKIPFPDTGSWDMRIDTRGEIAELDPAFTRIPAKSPGEAFSTSGTGRTVLTRYVKDQAIFCCPERANQAGGMDVLQANPEVAYTFHIDSQPIAGLGGSRRAVWCETFSGASPGPDGTMESAHR